MRKKWIWLAPLAIVALIGFIALGGFIVQQLWNWLTPALFGWRQITLWQGLAILVLCRILFGGLGGRGGGRSRMRHRMSDRMVDRMAGRMERMSPEERERFREAIRRRFGFGPPASEGESKAQ